MFIHWPTEGDEWSLGLITFCLDHPDILPREAGDLLADFFGVQAPTPHAVNNLFQLAASLCEISALKVSSDLPADRD